MKYILLDLLVFIALFSCANTEKIYVGSSKRCMSDSLIEYSLLEHPPYYKTLNYPVTEKFNFIIAYGMQGKNIINTFEKYFILDLVSDHVAKINLELDTKQMDSLYTFLKSNDFLNSYKNIKHTNLCFAGSQNIKSYMYFQYNGTVVKTGFGDNEQNDYLAKFFNKVYKMIISHKQYNKLPEPTGGYGIKNNPNISGAN